LAEQLGYVLGKARRRMGDKEKKKKKNFEL